MIAIGDQCDGLRCDMAMLMTSEVFARTWGDRAGPDADCDYWPTLIGCVKQAHPDLLFMAEANWEMEWILQHQGFGLCYDSDSTTGSYTTRPSRCGHMQADASYQERLIRFIEDHDEPRAAVTFGTAQACAAAVVISTLQSARLYHDGQQTDFGRAWPYSLGAGRTSRRTAIYAPFTSPAPLPTSPVAPSSVRNPTVSVCRHSSNQRAGLCDVLRSR